MPERYWIETLGCPKNQVDSDKIVGTLLADGYLEAETPELADLIVVNTCAFIEPAREESIDTVLSLAKTRAQGARLIVTGCLAARYGQELAEQLPEVDAVVDVGVPVQLSTGPRWRPSRSKIPALDLLGLPRRKSDAPWAYVKIAEGCDRRCGFCAIPSFRGPQRSRPERAILAEVDALGVSEVILVAQDLASYGRDLGHPGALTGLVKKVAARVDRVRLLYLYPSALTRPLIEAIVESGVHYFDLSLQHVLSRHLRKMRRVGSSEAFLARIEEIRGLAPGAVFRSNFILGYPGEREEDHDELLAFLAAAKLDWSGFFTYSEEAGTYAERLEDKVAPELALERLRECTEVQDELTARARQRLIGTTTSVLVDEVGRGRSYREAPEIDGIIHVPDELLKGSIEMLEIIGASGPDLYAAPLWRQYSVSTVKAFGPSAIVTPANALSMARLFATPVIIVLIVATGPATWLLWALWTGFSFSDALDGHLARWHGTTRSGAFLDPLADKFLVLGALFSLAAIGYVSYVPVAIIAAREVAMSLYRVRAGRRGISVPARSLAKAKTLVQDLAVGFALFPPVGLHVPDVAPSLLWLAVVLTAYTGFEYYRDARALMAKVASTTSSAWRRSMRVEILAVGTELLLGQILDTNSTYIAEQLASSGIECYFQTRVGDNIERVVSALEVALGRSDAVVVCGGLGPTQDDLTREAIAKVMGVPLLRDADALERLTAVFSHRSRAMSDNNLAQADVPKGARIIPQLIGTAPGLICPVGEKVIYAVPGVPAEMRDMIGRAVLADLRSRSGEPGVIMSRTLRTWGLGESLLAERLTGRIDELDAKSALGDGDPVPTLAFLASGVEGIKVRVTVRASDNAQAVAVLDEEEGVLRAILGEIVFGVDDETMESAIGALLVARHQRLCVAESFTGGLIAARVVSVAGASEFFIGGIVSYASSVKRELLHLSEGDVVTEQAAAAMAEGVRELFHGEVGLATTGVAGPEPQEGVEPGNGFVGLSIEGDKTEVFPLRIGGRRNDVRSIATITALDTLRRRLG